MFWELLLAILIGVICGVITGLIPGLHVNTISVVLLGLSPLLLRYTNVMSLAVLIISMSVVHTFLNMIPSIFLGAPESATALGVLPGHRYLLKGLGIMAVKLTLIGSFGALLMSIALFPLLVQVVRVIYPFLEKTIGYILVCVVVFMILRDKKKPWAVLVFVLSGTLGIIVLDWPNLSEPLFPLFSGLFGISTLLYSLNCKHRIPSQKMSTEIKLNKKLVLKALLSGNISGFITALLPGLGAATAAIISMQITKNLKHHGFMVLLGSVSTFNFVLSLITYYVVGKARNGSIIAVQKLLGNINTGHIIIFLSAALIAGSIAVFLTLRISIIFARVIPRLNYKMLVISVILFITSLVWLFTGFTGIAVLIIATAVGLIPAIVKVTRSHAMGCLLVPVIFSFLL